MQFQFKNNLWAIGYIYPEELKTGTWKRYLYTYVHTSIIHNSQKADVAQMYIDK